MASATAFVGGCAQPLSETLRNPAQAIGLPTAAPAASNASGSPGSTLAAGAGEPAAVDHDRRMAAFGEFGVEDDPAIKGYLDGLLKKITADAGLPDRCCRVEVVGSYSLDAYSRPSGTVFVPVGWLLVAESEDELVALLAHETGHIAKNHYATDVLVTGTTGLRQIYLAGTVAFAAATKTKVSLSFDRPLQYTALVTSRVIHPTLSRDQELEADRFAVDTTVHLGYSMSHGPRAFLEQYVSMEEAEKKAADAQAGQSALAQQMKEQLASLARKHDTARDRLMAADAYYEALPPPPPAAKAVTKASRSKAKLDGWKNLLKDRATARLMDAYRTSSDANERIADRRYFEAAALLKAVGPKMVSTHLPILMSQCTLYQASGNTAKANTCFDLALNGNFGSWRLYETRAEMLRKSGNAPGALALLEDGYQKLGTPQESLPTLVDYARDVDTKKRDDYNARCLLTDVTLRQACADALTSPAQKQAATDAEAKRITDKVMNPLTKGLDKITPKSR